MAKDTPRDICLLADENLEGATADAVRQAMAQFPDETLCEGTFVSARGILEKIHARTVVVLVGVDGNRANQMTGERFARNARYHDIPHVALISPQNFEFDPFTVQLRDDLYVLKRSRDADDKERWVAGITTWLRERLYPVVSSPR